MSDSDGGDDLEAIRERKRENLRREAGEDGAATGGTDEPIHVQGADHYRRLLEEHHVVLVDFYADWCGPCKLLEPTVEEVAAESDAAVLKVDIDEHQGLAQEMGVRGVPTLFVYADGEVSDQVVGVKEKAEIESMLRAAA